MTIGRQKPFDFGEAMIQLFRTSGGAPFAKRLWFWVTIPIALSLIIAVPLMAPHYTDYLVWSAGYMEAAMSGEQPDPEMFAEILPVLKQMIPGYIIMMLGMWIAAVLGEAALHRKILLGTETPGRPVRFGGDELRVMGAQLCVWGILLLIYIGGFVAAFAMMGLLGAVVGVIGAALGSLTIFAVLYFVIHYAVRLMPASALSVKHGSLRVWSATKITKGRFWPLFGAFVLVYIGGWIVSMVITQVGSLIVFGGNPAAEAMVPGGDITVIMEDAARRIKNPLVIFAGIVCVIAYSALMSIWFLCLSGIGTYAVRQSEGESIDATFD